MMKILKQFTIISCVLATMTGCAAVPSAAPNNDERSEAGTSSRLKNTLLAIGGVLIVGAIIANEAENNVEDAVTSGPVGK